MNVFDLAAILVAVAALSGYLNHRFLRLPTASGTLAVALVSSLVAMVLSLPPFPARDLLLACTYAVVLFSILVQGVTVRRVLTYYGVGESGTRT